MPANKRKAPPSVKDETISPAAKANAHFGTHLLRHILSPPPFFVYYIIYKNAECVKGCAYTLFFLRFFFSDITKSMTSIYTSAVPIEAARNKIKCAP